MYLKAFILDTEVKPLPGYHPLTGEPHFKRYLEADVLDRDTRALYRCSFRKGCDCELLLQAYQENWPEPERERVAATIIATAKQELEHQEKELLVKDVEYIDQRIILLVELL